MNVGNVRVEKGKHSIPIPEGLERLFEDLFNRCDTDFKDAEIVVKLGHKDRGTAHTPPISLVRLDERYCSIVFKAQPGGNDTCHKCYVRPPRGVDISLEDFSASLQKVLPKEEESKQEGDENMTDLGLVESDNRVLGNGHFVKEIKDKIDEILQQADKVKEILGLDMDDSQVTFSRSGIKENLQILLDDDTFKISDKEVKIFIVRLKKAGIIKKVPQKDNLFRLDSKGKDMFFPEESLSLDVKRPAEDEKEREVMTLQESPQESPEEAIERELGVLRGEKEKLEEALTPILSRIKRCERALEALRESGEA